MSLLDKKSAVSILAKTHENASTQIDVPGSVASKIIQIGQELIPDEALAGDGRVKTPHVTVKYGVQEDTEALRAVVSQFSPFTITLGNVEVFTPSESSGGEAPVVVEVHGAELGRLHKAVMQAMGTIGDDFPYVPHVTVAYVKNEEAQHFAGSDRFAGISFTATAVTLSFHDDDVQEKVPLGKIAAAPTPVRPEIPAMPPSMLQKEEPERRTHKYETRKQTHGDTWMIYDMKGDAVAFADSEAEANEKIRMFEANPGKKPHQVERTQPAVEAQPEQPAKRERKWKAPSKPVKDTTNFKRWFGASKVVDDDGNPLKVFHGTTHDIETFDLDKGNPENYYGKGLYFSSSSTDVESNYANPKGADLTSRLERRVEQIVQEQSQAFYDENQYYPEGAELQTLEELATDQAQDELVGPNQGVVMPVYLSIKNPVYVEKGGGTYFEISFDDETEEESGNGVDLYHAVLRCAGTYGADGGEIWSTINENGGGEFTAYDFEEQVRGNDSITDDQGNLVGGSFIADVYQELGYDGIIQDAYGQFGGGSKYKQMEMDYDTKHYIVFNPAQVKSATGNRGKFDKKNPAITGALKVAHASADVAAESILAEYAKNKDVPGYKMKWQLVPAARLKKIWNDYAKLGFVRDEKGMDDIAWLVLYNIFKLEVNTILCGHTSTAANSFAESITGHEYPPEYFEEADSFFEDEKGSWRISDYALDPLLAVAYKLEEASTAEEKLQLVDRALNIVHARSDLASWFVEGGTRTLNSLAGKTAAVQPKAKEFLKSMGQKVVEEKTIGDYDFFVTYDKSFGMYQIGMQRLGMDASDVEQQMEQQKQNRGAGSRQELTSTIQTWLNKYHILIIGSMNPSKTMKYVRMLKALGFDPQRRIIADTPFAFITDGTVKTSSIKVAGRKDAVTSMVITVSPEAVPWFPKELLIRYEQGMRWRQVLKSVKSIVGDVARKRVAWRDIYVWASPWENYEAQQEGWDAKKTQGGIMYDVLHNGAYVSVGAVPQPEPELVGTTEGTNYDPCPGCAAPMHMHPVEASHKTPPLSDTTSPNLGIGQETNAYADIPERVEGIYDTPSLEELAPQMFEKEGADMPGDLPEEDVDRTEEELAQIREDVKNVEYRFEVMDSHRGELSAEVGAWLNGQPIGYVTFSELENGDLNNPEHYKEEDDGYGGRQWEPLNVPREIHIKYVYVAPRYRRMGIGTGMYERIKQEFPDEKITSSGTTERGGKFRSKLTERGVIASVYGVDPEVKAISDKYEKLGVNCYISGSKVAPDYITLNEIVVPKDQRGEGLGSQFMEELTAYADRTGKIVVLTPDTTYGGSSVGRLQKFYGRFGFARNQGRNKDFRTRESMIRRPKTAAYAEQQNQVQHTDHQPYGMFKTDKANPFADEMEILHAQLGKPAPELAPGISTSGPKGNSSPDAQEQNKISAQADITSSPAFKAWFGASQVRDKNGKPVMAFHSTRVKKNFETFDTSPRNPDNRAQSTIDSIGAWFAVDTDMANEVMDFYEKRRGGAPRIMPVYLSIKNPIKVLDRNAFDQKIKAFVQKDNPKWWGDYEFKKQNILVGPKDVLELTQLGKKAMEDRGYDGAFIRDDSGNPVWVAFYPNQIKSAIGNAGTFSPDKPQITASQGEKTALGQAYLLHFDLKPTVKAASSLPEAVGRHEARHYLGWAKDAQDRIKQHYAGTASFTVAAVWDSPPLADGDTAPCPICASLNLSDAPEPEPVFASLSITAANYEEMFNSLKPYIVGGMGENKNNLRFGDITEQDIKDEIAWAKTYLKKSDRITWWLRWLRLSMLDKIFAEMKKSHDEVEALYNGLVSDPPTRHAVDFVKKQEQEKVQQGGEKLAGLKAIYDKELKAMTTRTGGVPWSIPDLRWYRTMHATMTHYLSLPVNKIQSVVWDKQAPDPLLTDFSNAEKEWQEQTKGTLVPNLKPREVQPEESQAVQDKLDSVNSDIEELEARRGQSNDVQSEDYQRWIDLKNERFALEQQIQNQGTEVDTVFLQFQDGWAWWKLSRAYCSEEAKAMGHCGNVVGQDKTDERIISLRKPVKAGKEDRWEPHLTFILEPNGLLGEMKGKANAKPVAAYHKYIIPLLEDPRIKGIRGGGYAPERNFSMADLPKEDQDRLIAAKPALMNCEQYLKRVGADEGLLSRITGMLEWNLKYSPELTGYILNTHSSLDDFIEERGNDDAKYIGKVLSGKEDLDTSYDYSEWEYAVDNLKAPQQELVANFIRASYPEELASWEEENDEFDGGDHDIKRVIEDMNLDEVKELLGRAMETGRRYGIEGQMYSAVLKAIDNMEDDDDNRLHVSVSYKTYTDPKTNKQSPVWDSPVTEYFGLEAACKLADSGSTWDQVTEDQYGRDESVLNITAPYNGWDEFDDNAFLEEVDEGFRSPETPAEVATKQQAMEEEAKVRPDMIPLRQNGKIVGWNRNPAYTGPALGPGGVLWDTENNKPLEQAKTKTKKKPTKKKKRKSSLLEPAARVTAQFWKEDSLSDVSGKGEVQAHREGNVVHIDWFTVDEQFRGQGWARKAYEQWEKSLPKDIVRLELSAAQDAGSGPVAGFWEKMGFDFIYNREVYDQTIDNAMWKGVNGHPTPKSKEVPEEYWEEDNA